MLQRDCAKAPWQREAGTARGPGVTAVRQLSSREGLGDREGQQLWALLGLKLEQTGCASGLDVGRGRVESRTSRVGPEQLAGRLVWRERDPGRQTCWPIVVTSRQEARCLTQGVGWRRTYGEGHPGPGLCPGW